MTKDDKNQINSEVVPTGLLKQLRVDDVKPSQNNPRQIFDEESLRELKESIREHGVLVPITVYRIRGQNKYAILDGERRYRCCVELEEEGKDVEIPANIVEPPTKVAGLLYMFSIHNFREQLELMPTAISLATVMKELKEENSKKLSKLTGLSDTSIERCKILLSFPERFQALSLDPDPQKRIPSNFWIEASPVIKIYESKLGGLIIQLGREALIDKLVQKYRDGKITSIIHFRRIVEADRRATETGQTTDFSKRLEEYIKDPELETRDAFDEFLPARNIKSALGACDEFVNKLKGLEEQLITEGGTEVIKKLKDAQKYLETLIERIGSDAPKRNDE